MSVTTAVLGGENRNSGGWLSNPVVRWFLVGTCLVVGSTVGGMIGFFGAMLVAVLVYVSTFAGGGDRSVAANIGARRRWRRTVRNGFDVFRPVTDRPVNCKPGSKDWNSYRDFTDGIDEWEWVSDPSDPAAPAITYHLCPDGTRYFAAAFHVDGPLVGLASDRELENAQTSFGKLLAGWASKGKLITGVQITTRMLPPGTVKHEAWMQGELDEATPDRQVHDYTALMAKHSSGRFVQRHYVTLRWDRTERFNSVVASYGKGRPGWLALLGSELESAAVRLRQRGYTKVDALTGPQLAGVVRHLQNPDYDPEQIADVTAAGMYRPSTSTETEVVTDERWQHRTAQVPIAAIETSERDGLWHRDLLVGMESRVLRTVSIHITLVPAVDAKPQARRDLTADHADRISQKEKGQIENDETTESLTAAQRRVVDMRPGTGHHGIEWACFVTITTPVESSMLQASVAIEEAASASGLNRLDWCDSYQAAAQSFTWPFARGLQGPPTTRSANVLERAAIWSKR